MDGVSQLTHRGHGDRYKTRYDKALSAKNLSVLKKEKGRPTSTSTTHDGSESADSIYISLARYQISPFNREQWFY